ncbi:copper chaperone PCu(A)C [Marinobacter lacisalsi]|uniref:Copper chaperone PCu(A)C n=1 Tax=Marinobacter lacisalsi TaxID=475979 RepID=A0ABV8QLP1_9GAMM
MLSKACIFSLGLLVVATPTLAQDYQHGDLTISHPWSRPTPPGTPVGVGYMTISNRGDAAVTLVAGQTPLAARVSIHETTMQDGLMKMRPLKDGLTVAAGETVTLKPHSYHLMLEQLERPLMEGDEVPLTLTFEELDPIAIKLHVEQPGAAPAMDHSGGHQSH